MRIVKQLLAVGAMFGALAIASPSLAVTTTFATYSQVSSERNVAWVKTGANGALFTISTPGSNVKGAVKVKFSFVLPGLEDFSDLAADYTLDATSIGTPVTITPAGANPFYDQGGLSGTFSFTYTGVNTVLNGIAVNTGANLLSGSFTNSTISGRKANTSGSFYGSTPDGVILYTSDFLNFSGTIARDFSTNFTSINPAMNATYGQPVDSFKASAGGAFSSEPPPTIPEPATWAMMILGFGLVGATVRRRRLIAA